MHGSDREMTVKVQRVHKIYSFPTQLLWNSVVSPTDMLHWHSSVKTLVLCVHKFMVDGGSSETAKIYVSPIKKQVGHRQSRNNQFVSPSYIRDLLGRACLLWATKRASALALMMTVAVQILDRTFNSIQFYLQILLYRILFMEFHLQYKLSVGALQK